MLRLYAISLVGSRRTWYSRVMPPKLETSTTLRTDLNCFSSVQSYIDFSSVKSFLGLVLLSVYQKIWPTGLQSVPICGCKPFGRVTCDSLSKTFWRFQSLIESSSKISITLDRPKSETERRCVRCGTPFI